MPGNGRRAAGRGADLDQGDREGRAGAGRPVSIAIPAAGLDARVVPVGLGADGTMEVPGVDLAGW